MGGGANLRFPYEPRRTAFPRPPGPPEAGGRQPGVAPGMALKQRVKVP